MRYILAILFLVSLKSQSQTLWLDYNVTRTYYNHYKPIAATKERVLLVFEGEAIDSDDPNIIKLTERLGIICQDTLALIHQQGPMYKEEHGAQTYFITIWFGKEGHVIIVSPLKPFTRENMYSLNLQSL